MIEYKDLTEEKRLSYVQEIACELIDTDTIELTGDELGGAVSAGSISWPAMGVGAESLGLEVVFYSPMNWTQCLHRGCVVDYEDGIVDISWTGAILDRASEAGFEECLHTYEACCVSLVQ